MRKLVLPLLLIVLLSGCASKYNFIRPNLETYTSFTESENGVKVKYRQEVMYLNRNRKQVRKEKKHDISVLAVRIENNSDQTLVVGQNARFYAGDSNPVYIFHADESYNLLKQKWGFHLFYLGLTPFSGTFAIGGFYAAGSFGILLGPGLALYNSLRANKANKRLKTELARFSIANQEIPPDTVIDGIVVIEGQLDQPLYLKFVD